MRGRKRPSTTALVDGRYAGQDAADGCGREAGCTGEFRPDAQEKRAAVPHPLGDVGNIGHRQQAAVLEAVQDDQVEFVDLVQEQFAYRERDQRKFIQRRQIVLLRRPQNGEVHQIHRRIRLQQPPPGALAGMRFTGNQQHAQTVTHAVDLYHSAVVDCGDLALERIGRQFDHRRASAADRDVDRLLDTDRHTFDPNRLAIATDRETGREPVG